MIDSVHHMNTKWATQQIRLLIGGLSVAIVGDATLRRATELNSLQPFRDDTSIGAPQLVIQLDCPLPKIHCQWLTKFDIVDGNSICRFGKDDNDCYHYTIDDNVRLRYDPRLPNKIQVTPITDLAHLSFSLWLAYALLALPFGRMPIHSSAIVCDGYAVMCLGESGTGKSTHTHLWLRNIPNTKLLNDDSPILAVSDDKIVLYGSPWSGKSPCYLQASAPVAALIRIEQQPRNTIRRLPIIEAFTALQPSCPPSLATDEKLLDHIVSLISMILKQIPVFRLGCLPNDDAAQLCHDTIFSNKQ